MVNLPVMQETSVWSRGWEVPLENGMAIHFSILAWRIPQTEKPGGPQSLKSQRVGHDWATNTHTHYKYALRLVQSWDSPGSPVVKTPCFHCRWCRFNPWSRNLRSHMPCDIAKIKIVRNLSLHLPLYIFRPVWVVILQDTTKNSSTTMKIVTLILHRSNHWPFLLLNWSV